MVLTPAGLEDVRIYYKMLKASASKCPGCGLESGPKRFQKPQYCGECDYDLPILKR